MIEDRCEGIVYYFKKSKTTYEDSNLTVCRMMIQYDIDCLKRKRTVGYSSNHDLIKNGSLPAHRIDLANNPGEIFETSNSIRLWNYQEVSAFYNLDKFFMHINDFKNTLNKKETKAFGNVYLKDESIGNCHCSNCDGSIDTHDKFCRYCGCKIISIRYNYCKD